MTNLQKLEQKIGEALGLEKAAQIAVEDLSAKGLLDEGGMKDKLQTMKRQANNHEAKLEELIPDLESEGLSSENISSFSISFCSKQQLFNNIYSSKLIWTKESLV